MESPSSELALQEAQKIGFNASAQERFGEAWGKDITSTSQAEWHSLVTSCANSQNPTLRLWGLGRLVEAGEQDKVETYGSLMAGMLESFKKGDPDWRNSPLAGPATLPGASWQIRRESPFWKFFKKQVLVEGDKVALERLYAIWSWNGSMEDKDTMTELASHLASSSAAGTAESSPWDDPRFWMVMDWLCEYGDRADWDRITALFPKGSKANKDATSIYGDLKDMPAFWGPACSSRNSSFNQKVRPVLRFSMHLLRDEWAKKLAVRGRFEFKVCTGHDGKTSRCRPWPSPWVAAATLTGVHQISSWVSVYPGIEKDKWPADFPSVTGFVLK